MAGKAALPSVPASSLGTDRQQFDTAVRQMLGALTGQVGGRIDELPSTAVLADVITKVNEIIRRLQ